MMFYIYFLIVFNAFAFHVFSVKSGNETGEGGVVRFFKSSIKFLQAFEIERPVIHSEKKTLENRGDHKRQIEQLTKQNDILYKTLLRQDSIYSPYSKVFVYGVSSYEFSRQNCNCESGNLLNAYKNGFTPNSIGKKKYNFPRRIKRICPSRDNASFTFKDSAIVITDPAIFWKYYKFCIVVLCDELENKPTNRSGISNYTSVEINRREYGNGYDSGYDVGKSYGFRDGCLRLEFGQPSIRARKAQILNSLSRVDKKRSFYDGYCDGFDKGYDWGYQLKG